MDRPSVQSVPSIEEDEWASCDSGCGYIDNFLFHISFGFPTNFTLLKSLLIWILSPYSSWVSDADGLVIPSLAVESCHSNPDVQEPSDLKPSSPKVIKVEEKIYLRPHGAPTSQANQQELNIASRKQKFRQKLKEADRKFTGLGQENKVENLKELVGSKSGAATMPKSSPRNWLDPHCLESQFERYSN